MSKRSKGKNAARPKTSLYEEITAQVVADLKAGVFPWARPWGSQGKVQAIAPPKNALSRKTYSGINILILWGAV